MSLDEDLYNLRVLQTTPLLSPNQLSEALPVTEKAKATILHSRQAIQDILDQKDHRIMLICGPCSIHDPKAAIEYAQHLQKLSTKVADKFLVIMRVYFEKPRTTVGWKGLINDPDLNDTFDITRGLHIARSLLLQINELGLPAATEALDPIMPQYIGDLISWTAIGARTAESQTHREMSSGLSTPVGFKNGTDGSLEVAINAIESASRSHSFLGVDAQGMITTVRSSGNPYGHVVLRGGNDGPNYDASSVALCIEELQRKGLKSNLVIDCSHANSNKNPQNQPFVISDIIQQIRDGNQSIVGLMIESNLQAGNQKLSGDLSQLAYGVSITDGCIDWQTTEQSILEAYQLLS